MSGHSETWGVCWIKNNNNKKKNTEVRKAGMARLAEENHPSTLNALIKTIFYGSQFKFNAEAISTRRS